MCHHSPQSPLSYCNSIYLQELMQVYILLLFCQIGDFGLSRKLDDDTVYYVTSGGMVPVNWTAPEVYIYASTATLQGRTSVLSYPHVYINNHLRI